MVTVTGIAPVSCWTLVAFRASGHRLLSFFAQPNTQHLMAVYRNRACIRFSHILIGGSECCRSSCTHPSSLRNIPTCINVSPYFRAACDRSQGGEQCRTSHSDAHLGDPNHAFSKHLTVWRLRVLYYLGSQKTLQLTMPNLIFTFVSAK